jgi:hypothetical protein
MFKEENKTKRHLENLNMQREYMKFEEYQLDKQLEYNSKKNNEWKCLMVNVNGDINAYGTRAQFGLSTSDVIKSLEPLNEEVKHMLNEASYHINVNDKDVSVIDSELVSPVLDVVKGDEFHPGHKLIHRGRAYVQPVDLHNYDSYFKLNQNESEDDTETDSDEYLSCDEEINDAIIEMDKAYNDIRSTLIGKAVVRTFKAVNKHDLPLNESVKEETLARIAYIKERLEFFKTELETKPFIRSKTEILRDNMISKTNKKKTMVKDRMVLIREESNYDSESEMLDCFMCKRRLHIKDTHRCHIVSKVDGGDCSIDNLVLGCSGCNTISGQVNALDVRACL